MQRDWAQKVHATTYDFISPLRLDLSGKHVVITGGSFEDGVGYAAATAFARAGATVIAILDLNGLEQCLVEKLTITARDAGRPEPTIVSAKVDISDLNSVSAAYETLAPVFGSRLDVLLNNAAHMEPFTNILDADPEVYWRTWEVNIRGLFNMTRVFLPLLLSKDGLRTMINVASSGGLSVRPKSSGYRSSKLAILRWTENVQVDHLDDGLLAYCVNPGAIKTQITMNTPEEIRNRLPHKADIAGDTIVWLASVRRDWLAGRYISCPWDMEELLARKDEIVSEDKLKLRLVW